MELKSFIKESLEQIVSGIAEAQGTELGGNINASTEGGSASKDLGGNLINRGAYGVFTRVDFDVSVAAENTAGGGLKVAAFGQGISAGGENRLTSANRLCFSVPVRLPDGSREHVEQMQEKRRTAPKPRKAEKSAYWDGTA